MASIGTTSVWVPASEREIFDLAPVASAIVGPDARVERSNAAARRLIGPDLRGGARLTDHVHTDDRPALELLVSALATSSPEQDRLDVRLRRVTGETTTARVQSSRLSGDRVLLQFVEIDDCGGADQRLAEQRAFRSALLELSDLSHDTDDDAEFYATLLQRATEVIPGAQAGSVLVRNGTTDEYHFVAAVGYELPRLQEYFLREEEMFRDVDNPVATITTDSDIDIGDVDPERAEMLRTVGRIEEIVVNVSAPVVSGGEPVAFISLDNFEDPGAFNETSVEMMTVLGRLIADLSRRRELEAALRGERESFRHQALHDELTGVANRRHLEDRIDEVIASSDRHGRPFGLLFVDIDDFKTVNDTFGHAVGDDVLVEVADRLRRAVRAGDLVGRWGGDEFVVVAPESAARDDIERLSERILEEFAEPVVIDAHRIAACISVGAAWASPGVGDREAVVRRADAALYEAKAAGKGVARLGSL
ncbi:MAG: GGDEF domain-containing protein [Actinomycetota bacterium]